MEYYQLYLKENELYLESELKKNSTIDITTTM